MVAASRVTHGAARVAAFGIGHSAAYLIGAIVLGFGCARRTRCSIVPSLLPIAAAIAVVLAFGVWVSLRALDPSGRPATVACLALVGGAGTGVYALAVRRWWRTPSLTAPEV